MPGSTPDVPSAPQYTEDSPAAAFCDVLDSFSAPPGGENPATLHLFSCASLPPAPTPGTEAAVKGADSSAQAGGLTSGFGSKMPNAMQEAASAAPLAFLALATPTRSDKPAAPQMSDSALLSQPSAARRLPPELEAEKRIPVSQLACAAAPAAGGMAASATRLTATGALGPEAETRPREAVSRPIDLVNAPLETASGANQSIRPISTPPSLAFAARLVEQPTNRAEPDGVRTPLTSSNESLHPLSPPPSIPLPTVEQPATEAADLGHAAPISQGEPAPETVAHITTEGEFQGVGASAGLPVTVPLAKDAAALSSTPQTGSEHPQVLDTPTKGIQAPGPAREDADSVPLAPRVEHRDEAANPGRADGPSTPTGGSVQQTPAFEMQQTPSRSVAAAPAEPGKPDPTAMAQVLSGSEPCETAATGPAQNISVRLSTDQSPAVEVRVMDRGGEVHVAVHSPDAATSESVRAGLPDLVAKLGQRGYEAEIWHPPAGSSSSSTNTQRESGGAFGRGEQQQPDGQQPRQQPRQQQPAWVEEMQKNMNHTTERSPFTWPPQPTR